MPAPPSSEAVADLTQRTTFQHWITHTLRYNDQDPIGHVNNAVFATFLEQGRTAFLYPIIKSADHPTLDIVLARVVIDYRRELNFPGSVEIGSRLIRLGSKSFVIANGIFVAGDGVCAATGEATLVFFDTATRTSTLPPPKVRAAFEALLAAPTP